tara:strand:- start:1346 stop:2857 length:1512 start_codon:yes stop_codon:yes gene_type:complete
MVHTIIDAYTDEASGLGVPPYLGTHVRYVAGVLDNPNYLTIDDLRLLMREDKRRSEQKTDRGVKNATRSVEEIKEILGKTKLLVVVGGIHVPGKYLSAQPATISEIIRLVKPYTCHKVLYGPAYYGSEVMGGGVTTKDYQGKILENFNELIGPGQLLKLVAVVKNVEYTPKKENYSDIEKYIIKGASIVKQHPDFPKFVMYELETGRGCGHGLCSFCTEGLKHALEFRSVKSIISEMKLVRDLGVENFRFGKQSCFYSYQNGDTKSIEKLLKLASKLKPKVLHIDNVDPIRVDVEKTKLIVKYCTPGNVAAMGVETFDKSVMKKNRLNVKDPEEVIRAVKIINKYGLERGENGMPKFLPGINLILGLEGETKETLELNKKYLQYLLDNDLFVRRINIRQVAILLGTQMGKVGLKYVKKNKKHYFKFRKEIREKIDHEMLKKLFPEGTILKNLRTEIHDGNVTFCRQIATYPLIVGVRERVPLNEFKNVKIKKWMLRSIVAELT